MDQNTNRVSQKFEQINFSRMDGVLDEAQTQLKVMSAILTRLIPENDNHTLIHESRPNRVQVIPNYLMNFKLNCCGRSSPCVLKFIY